MIKSARPLHNDLLPLTKRFSDNVNFIFFLLVFEHIRATLSQSLKTKKKKNTKKGSVAIRSVFVFFLERNSMGTVAFVCYTLAKSYYLYLFKSGFICIWFYFTKRILNLYKLRYSVVIICCCFLLVNQQHAKWTKDQNHHFVNRLDTIYQCTEYNVPT